MSLHAINGVVSGRGQAREGGLKMSLHAINDVVSGGGRVGRDRDGGFLLAQIWKNSSQRFWVERSI
jgi:hypothetical protein